MKPSPVKRRERTRRSGAIDNSQRDATPPVASESRGIIARARKLTPALRRLDWTWLALGAVALVALALRLYGLNWDANNHLHPDEREIVFRAMCLTFPGQEALRPGNCDPAVTGPGWLFSPASPLNPHFFAYGSFPLYLLALVARGRAWLTLVTGGHFVPWDGGTWDDFNHFTLVGRALSALFDTGSVLVVGLMGRRLAGRGVAVLAAALVAVLPFELQVAHFYAVDTVLTFFVLLTLLGCLRLAQAAPSHARGGQESQAEQSAGSLWHTWGAGLLVGLSAGLAVASKVSALPLILPIALALMLRWRRRGAQDAMLAGVGVFSAALLAFIITSPYALIDWHTFQTQVAEQTALSRGQLDYPYVRQFANTTPYLYEIQQLLLYDMGLPLGLLGLGGAAWAGWRVWRRWDDDWLPIIGWVVVYFVIIGSAYTKFTRYMLPIFPLLALCGAAALAALAAGGVRWLSATPPGGERARACSAMLAPLRSAGQSVRALTERLTDRYGVRWWRVTIAAVGLVVLGSTALLGLALDNIYSTPNTRVQASEWIYDHVAPGATITSEVWDDPLPILVPPAETGPGFGRTAAGHVIDPGQYANEGLNLYDADTSQKLDQLTQQLARADVVVISSQRLLRSIPKLPDRYPMTTRYYDLLFSGQLGFRLAATFQNAPHFLGFTLRDTGADESYSVYDHPPVWIFVRAGDQPSAQDVRARLTAGITLPAASNRSGSQKSLLLSPADLAANNQSPALGVQFPADSLPNRAPLLWWLLVIELLGVVSFPLTYLALPGLRDRGWGFSKLIGLLALAYVIWLPASLRVLPFARETVVAAFALLAVAGVALAWWRRVELLDFVRSRWRLLAVCEGGFLASFAFFAWIRALDPDLWHIWRGGEKPMELAFLDAILRSRYLPPLDPHFAGGYINYYYYGQYLIALLARLTGIAPTTAFNLAIPLLFGLCFTGAFSVLAGLTRRWWAGLAGGVALVFVCNLDGAWQAISQWSAFIAHIPVPPFDYWRSSRVIPYTINEFPYWSFLYADLHAHLIDLPVVVLVVGVCASLLSRRAASGSGALPTLALAALALGTAACTNLWDFPTFGFLLVAVLALREMGFGNGVGWQGVRERLRWPVIRRLIATSALPLGAALALFLPFFGHFQTFVSGTGAVTRPTDPNQFFTLFGIWLFLLASFFVVEALDRWERARASQSGAGRRRWILAVGSVAVLALAYMLSVKALLIVLLIAGLILALDPRHTPIKLLTYALVLLGLAIALGVEVIYVRDFLDNGDWERMNTVFKFYYQVWVCFALGGALAFAQLAPRVLPAADGTAPVTDVEEDYGSAPAAMAPTRPATAWSYGFDGKIVLRGLWLSAFMLLLAGSLVFVVEGTSVRVRDPDVWAQVQPPPGGIQPQGLSLDGMAYMRGWYPGDYAAITWMNTHINGTPTIIEASNGPYQWYGRVSIYTGLPAVVQTIHESEQRYPDQVYARQNDVQLFFTTADPQAALDILHQYGVRYVYIGDLERNCLTLASATCVPAPGPAVAKYQTLVEQGSLKPIYSNSSVTIYEVVR